MTFKNTIITEEVNEAQNISVDTFLSKVDEYSSVDVALAELPAEYLEFYAKNEKKLQKALKKLGLAESMNEDYASPGSPGYLGWSKDDEKKIKTIKYKGNLLHLIWDPKIGTWMPFIGFRSVTGALKYAKTLVENV